MVSKQKQLKRALKQRKKPAPSVHKDIEHPFEDLIQRKETDTRIGALAFDHPPRTFKEKRDILHFQWLQGAHFMERTDAKRVALDQYNGSWVRIAGVASEAKLVRGVLRICVAAPELVLEEKEQILTSLPIDSHIWIKMNTLVLNDNEDGRVDNRPEEALNTTMSKGEVSLGDYFIFDALIEPYVVRRKVKYGVSKIKNISMGGLLWSHIRSKTGRTNYIMAYPRVGWLIQATPIEGTSKFSYRFADWAMLEKQKQFFENYRSTYSVIERKMKDEL